MLYELDLLVGYAVSSLEKRNLLDKTLVIFLSDNGGVSKANTPGANHGNGNLRGMKVRIQSFLIDMII